MSYPGVITCVQPNGSRIGLEAWMYYYWRTGNLEDLEILELLEETERFIF